MPLPPAFFAWNYAGLPRCDAAPNAERHIVVPVSLQIWRVPTCCSTHPMSRHPYVGHPRQRQREIDVDARHPASVRSNSEARLVADGDSLPDDRGRRLRRRQPSRVRIGDLPRSNDSRAGFAARRDGRASLHARARHRRADVGRRSRRGGAAACTARSNHDVLERSSQHGRRAIARVRHATRDTAREGHRASRVQRRARPARAAARDLHL